MSSLARMFKLAGDRSIEVLPDGTARLTPKRITMMQLRRRPGEFMDKVKGRGETFIVERNGEPVALLTPITPGLIGRRR